MLAVAQRRGISDRAIRDVERPRQRDQVVQIERQRAARRCIAKSEALQRHSRRVSGAHEREQRTVRDGQVRIVVGARRQIDSPSVNDEIRLARVGAGKNYRRVDTSARTHRAARCPVGEVLRDRVVFGRGRVRRKRQPLLAYLRSREVLQHRQLSGLGEAHCRVVDIEL